MKWDCYRRRLDTVNVNLSDGSQQLSSFVNLMALILISVITLSASEIKLILYMVLELIRVTFIYIMSQHI